MVNILNSIIVVSSKFSRAITGCLNIHKTHHHHHHVMPLGWISLTLSRHFSLSFIVSGRSSGLHPVSSHSCCMYVLAGRPAFARSYVGVHRSTSLMSSSLLLQQCPVCLVRLTWIIFVKGGRWPYSWYLAGCCREDLFNLYIYVYVGCLNIHGTHVSANNSTTNNNVFFFCFRFENCIL